MTAKNSGLGRGFDTLIPQNFDQNILLSEDERIVKIQIDRISPNRDQPRKDFDEGQTGELASSIKRHGILQPLVLTPSGEDYEIIAGERRWRAAQLVGLDSVPAIIRTVRQIEQFELALVENVQRVDLSPLEEAESIAKLHNQFNLTYKEIGERLGKGTATVSNSARLLQLPEDVRRALATQKISEGHARTILSFNGNPAKQTELLNAIIKNGWSVRQAERFVTAYKKGGAKDREEAVAKVKTVSPETKLLSKRISAPVNVRRMAYGGKLEISFKTEKDLERIIARLLK